MMVWFILFLCVVVKCAAPRWPECKEHIVHNPGLDWPQYDMYWEDIDPNESSCFSRPLRIDCRVHRGEYTETIGESKSCFTARKWVCDMVPSLDTIPDDMFRVLASPWLYVDCEDSLSAALKQSGACDRDDPDCENLIADLDPSFREHNPKRDQRPAKSRRIGWKPTPDSLADAEDALWNATAEGYAEVVDLILNYTTLDLDKPRNGKTLLWKACVNNDTEMAHVLLEHGANPNVNGGPTGFTTTSLWKAAINNNRNILRMLFDPTAKPSKKMTDKPGGDGPCVNGYPHDFHYWGPPGYIFCHKCGEYKKLQ